MSKKTDVIQALRSVQKTSSFPIRIGERDIEITAYHCIADEDRVQFVQNVADGIIRDGKRCFALYDGVFSKNVLTFLTDLRFTFTAKDLCVLTQCTDIMQRVSDHIGTLIQSLDAACRAQIKAAQKTEIAVAAALVRPDPMDRIADAAENLLAEISGSFDGVDQNTLSELNAFLKGKDVAQIVSEKLYHESEAGDGIGTKNVAEPIDKP